MVIINKQRMNKNKPKQKEKPKWRVCAACEGTKKNSKGASCHPCSGKGRLYY